MRLLPLLLLAGTSALPAQQSPLDGFDPYVAKAVRDWEVPGLSIAIVRGDSTVFAKGYGVRRLGGNELVDANTLFAVGSTTKAMTATLVAMLADERKLGLDDRVVDHLPEFRLADPAATAELTIRDLLTHRTGLGNTDFLWYARTEDFDRILHRLRWAQSAPPRSRYVYQNVMYATAGKVAEARSRTPWEELVRDRIFRPLGMDSTLATMAGLSARANIATPHDVVGGKLSPIEWRNLDNVAPAGSVNSSAADMARWMRFVLDSMRVGGRRLLSAERYREMFEPQFVVPDESYYPAAREAGAHFSAYGLGWFLQDFRGRLLAMHTGSIDGMVAIIGLLPEERTGVVVLANRDHAEVRHALMYAALDRFTGKSGKDWSRDVKRVYDSIAATGEAARRAAEASRVTGTRPSLALEAYAGEYADSLHGDVRLAVEGGRLVARVDSGFVGDLEHWHHDTFRATWRDPSLGRGLFTFVLDPARRRVIAVEGSGARWARRREAAP